MQVAARLTGYQVVFHRCKFTNKISIAIIFVGIISQTASLSPSLRDEYGQASAPPYTPPPSGRTVRSSPPPPEVSRPLTLSIANEETQPSLLPLSCVLRYCQTGAAVPPSPALSYKRRDGYSRENTPCGARYASFPQASIPQLSPLLVSCLANLCHKVTKTFREIQVKLQEMLLLSCFLNKVLFLLTLLTLYLHSATF